MSEGMFSGTDAHIFRNVHIWHTRFFMVTFEPVHDKTNKMACAASEDSDLPGHLPSQIRVFACTQ